jgi:hypothetical protein
MPGAPDREQPIPVRRFQGTMLALDPAFVPVGFLARCDNWVPDPTYVLTKRLGSNVWQTFPGGTRVDPLIYTTGSDGHRYLYAVAAPASGDAGGSTIYVSVDDGTFTAVPNGKFASANPTGPPCSATSSFSGTIPTRSSRCRSAARRLTSCSSAWRTMPAARRSSPTTQTAT